MALAAELAVRLDVATEAALAAGSLLRQYRLTSFKVEEKRPGDLVTEADRASEALILATLTRHYPNDSILTEESGDHGDNQGSFRWVIDPLDGTTNYAHGFPFASVSIGLLHQGTPVLGVVYGFFHDELFCACQDQGSTLNRRPIRVSDATQLNHSLLVTGFAYDRRDTPDNNYAEFCHFTHLTQGVRRGGSAALDLAYVAAGQLDGYWERGLSSWDITAGVVLVQEAGGQVTAYDGSPLNLTSGRILATNGHLHKAMQTELAKVRPLQETFPMTS